MKTNSLLNYFIITYYENRLLRKVNAKYHKLRNITSPFRHKIIQQILI